VKPKPKLFALSTIFVAIALLLAFRSAAHSDDYRDSRKNSPYHKHPSRSPLPSTLDPSQFKANPNPYVAYTLAARIRELLYREPCFCGCRRSADHQSLLDCFTSRHGVFCGLCQSEVIFCYEQNKLHKSPGHIRKAMLKNQWGGLDLDAYVRAYLATEGTSR
jgi:hypothetical protein